MDMNVFVLQDASDLLTMRANVALRCGHEASARALYRHSAGVLGDILLDMESGSQRDAIAENAARLYRQGGCPDAADEVLVRWIGGGEQ